MVGRSLAKGKRGRARVDGSMGNRTKDSSAPAPASAATPSPPATNASPYPATASTGSYEPMTPVSDNASISHAPAMFSWASEQATAPEFDTTTSLPTATSWSDNNLGSRSTDPLLIVPPELENPLAFPSLISNPMRDVGNNRAANPGQGLLDADFDLDFGEYCLPEALHNASGASEPNKTVRGNTEVGEHTHRGVHNPEPVLPPKVTELLDSFDQPGLLDQFPHVSSLAKIIGLLEQLIQNKATTIDEVLRVNKFCMSVISGIMSSDYFKKCKSCRMLILTAMDLVLNLYETGVSEDMNLSSQSGKAPCVEQTASQKASLQFGVFQFEPEDHMMIRNQIVRNELRRCIQMIQDQSSELRASSSDGSIPSHKSHENWLSVIENRARMLISSLKSTDVDM